MTSSRNQVTYDDITPPQKTNVGNIEDDKEQSSKRHTEKRTLKHQIIQHLKLDKTQKGELSKGKVERYQYDDKVGMYFDKELNLYLDSSSGISCCSSTILRTKIYHDTVNNCAYVWNALDQIYQMLELPSNYILKKQQEITGSIKPKKKKKRKAKGRQKKEEQQPEEHQNEKRPRNEDSDIEDEHDTTIKRTKIDDSTRNEDSEFSSGKEDISFPPDMISSLQGVPPKTEQESSSKEEQRFVYDETTGLYCDRSTNLYYHPQNPTYWYDYSKYPVAVYFWNGVTNTLMKIKAESATTQTESTTSTDEGGIPSIFILQSMIHEGERYYIGEGFGSAQTVASATVTIGRSHSCDIVIKDLEVSKHHAKILWERVYWENTFWLMDEGSVNGTFLNDKRISESKVPLQEKKSKYKVVKPDPALYKELLRSISSKERQSYTTPTNQEFRKHLKMTSLKMTTEEWKERTESQSKYVDRAQQRRELYKNSMDEVSQFSIPADTRIKELQNDNKGFQLLSKMGWQKGQGLGANSEGITAPIALSTAKGRQGLGFST